ncbi:unnamed protein product [Nippostrongylus brasiliensis]|uniref:Uncharacterized protein n=1 Tax=Nippostrongylus brasiliensis TaxID=27835 RepID=A0A0N4YV41_NIPBR|nr:unnamed protein product [Nippostrongylus brasiliensis]
MFMELGKCLRESCPVFEFDTSSPGSSAPPSPRFRLCNEDINLLDSQSSQDQSPPRLLRPQSLLSPYPDSASPPRSNSVDLSTLRRDIELLSISSGDSPSESEFEPPTPADSVKTARSRSHDPAATTSVLRRPSRIEHLSELFRKALAKSPVVRKTAVEQERMVNKHRTSRYWLDEQIHAAEHIWLPSSGPGSSTSIDSECYVGEKVRTLLVPGIPFLSSLDLFFFFSSRIVAKWARNVVAQHVTSLLTPLVSRC